MPIMDGMEPTTLIRKHERLGTLTRTPIIALTAEAMSVDQEDRDDVQRDENLTKPLSQRQMMQIISKYTSRPSRSSHSGREVRGSANKDLSRFTVSDGHTEGITKAKSRLRPATGNEVFTKIAPVVNYGHTIRSGLFIAGMEENEAMTSMDMDRELLTYSKHVDVIPKKEIVSDVSIGSSTSGTEIGLDSKITTVRKPLFAILANSLGSFAQNSQPSTIALNEIPADDTQPKLRKGATIEESDHGKVKEPASSEVPELASNNLTQWHQSIGDGTKALPSNLQIMPDTTTGTLDRIKGFIEESTQESWDWWPLRPLQPVIQLGFVRVQWHCVST